MNEFDNLSTERQFGLCSLHSVPYILSFLCLLKNRSLKLFISINLPGFFFMFKCYITEKEIFSDPKVEKIFFNTFYQISFFLLDNI